MKNSRRNARILAFQVFFSRQSLGVVKEIEDQLFLDSHLDDQLIQFAQALVHQTGTNQVNIDQQIQSALINWKQERLSNALNALMRIATGELLYWPDTDPKIIINEALEICKCYVGNEAVKLLNGTLHSLASKQSQ